MLTQKVRKHLVRLSNSCAHGFMTQFEIGPHTSPNQHKESPDWNTEEGAHFDATTRAVIRFCEKITLNQSLVRYISLQVPEQAIKNGNRNRRMSEIPSQITKAELATLRSRFEHGCRSSPWQKEQES